MTRNHQLKHMFQKRRLNRQRDKGKGELCQQMKLRRKKRKNKMSLFAWVCLSYTKRLTAMRKQKTQCRHQAMSNVRLMDKLSGQDENSSAWTICAKFWSKVELCRKQLENVRTSKGNPYFAESTQVKLNVHLMDKMFGNLGSVVFSRPSDCTGTRCVAVALI